jgi:hypothetical protein
MQLTAGLVKKPRRQCAYRDLFMPSIQVFADMAQDEIRDLFQIE